MTKLAPHANTTQVDVEQLKQQVNEILAEAERQGANAAAVNLGVSQGLSVEVRMGGVDTLEFHHNQGVSLTVYVGQRTGSASSTDTSPNSIKETVAAALAIAKHTGEDEANGLAPKELLAQADSLPALDLHHPWALSPEEAITLAQRVEQAGREDKRIVNSDGATVTSGFSVRAYGNTQGFVAAYPSTSHGMSCALVAEAKGEMQRDYYYHAHRNPAMLMAPEEVGAKAAERTLSRLGAKQPATGKWPVIFHAEVARGLLGHFISAISGGALYRKASFMLDRLDTPVFPEWVTLAEHPHLLQGPASAPFDSDGLPTRAQSFVEAGVLRSYVLSLYSSRRLGLAPTGNGGGVRNLVLPAGDKNLAQLCAQMGTGILVTELMGQGVNALTGDYSRGAAGYWVENGVIAHPLEEFTVAGNLADMFMSIEAVGNDVDQRGGIHTGSLLLAPLTVAGA